MAALKLKSNIIELVCRTCLKMNKMHFNIFEHTQNDKLISDMIMECASIKVEKDDGFPVNICNSCIDKLNSACDFKAMIIQSNTKLQKFYLNKMVERKDDSQRNDNTIFIREEDLLLKTEQTDPSVDVGNVDIVEENRARGVVATLFEEEEKEDIEDAAVNQYDFPNDSFTRDDSDSNKEMSDDGNDTIQRNVSVKNKMRLKRETNKVRFIRKKKIQNISEIEHESSDHDDIGDGESSNDSEGSSDTTDHSSKPRDEAKQVQSVKVKEDKTKKNYNNINERQAELLDNPDYQRIINSGLSKKEKDRETVFCRECGKRLTFRYYVAVHAHTHTGNIPYKCEKCGRAFAKESLLRNHMRVHAETRDFSCEVCGKSFRTVYSLRIHRVNHTEERPHKCQVCGNAFKSTATLKKHELIHRNDRKYMCELCGRSFIEKVGLRKHMITHSTERNFMCTTCGKSFSSKRNLCDHLKRHSNERPYICNHCGKRFKYNTTLRNHISLHTGPKLFPCEVCGKNFRQRASLPKHMRIHTGETPYPCEFCPSKFKYSHHLQNHVRVHHKDKYGRVYIKRSDSHERDSRDFPVIDQSQVKSELCLGQL